MRNILIYHWNRQHSSSIHCFIVLKFFIDIRFIFQYFHLLNFLLYENDLSFSCNGSGANEQNPPASNGNTTTSATASIEEDGKAQKWEGVFTNGMKETKISFNVSADGQKITDLTFDGYWRCSGKLTKDILGPEEAFDLKNGVVNGIIVDKTAYIRYELKGKLTGRNAAGTFRMSITGLGCDTYVLNWTATRKG